jgi:hypothetical protein
VPVVVPSVVCEPAVVGFCEVPQQTPLTVIVPPPFDVIVPPAVAELLVIAVAAVVVSTAKEIGM